jgi:hypothetical protein
MPVTNFPWTKYGVETFDTPVVVTNGSAGGREVRIAAAGRPDRCSIPAGRLLARRAAIGGCVLAVVREDAIVVATPDGPDALNRADHRLAVVER